MNKHKFLILILDQIIEMYNIINNSNMRSLKDLSSDKSFNYIIHAFICIMSENNRSIDREVKSYITLMRSNILNLSNNVDDEQKDIMIDVFDNLLNKLESL